MNKWTKDKYNPGDTVNGLLILTDTKKRIKHAKIFKYKCRCGKTFEDSSRILISHKKPSCGCQTLKLYQKSRRNKPGENSYNFLYNRNKNNARNRNYEFKLTKSEFKEIVSQNCFYCGLEPQPYNYYLKTNGDIKKVYHKITSETIDRSWIKVNGIDRIDNNVGYIIENCTSCCPQCNTSKLNYTLNEFNIWLERIFNYKNGFKN